MSNEDLMEKIVSLSKRRGFIFQGSEIYGGFAGTWDYGPRGVALKENIKRLWWKMFVDSRDDMYGVDAAILMNKKVWEASGHTGAGFADPLVDCKECGFRQRADHLVESDKEFFMKRVNEYMNENTTFTKTEGDSFMQSSGVTNDDFDKARSALSNYTGPYIQRFLNENISCSRCGQKKWNEPRRFNLMFETKVGAEGTTTSYLRPETAQGIFVNFKNVVDSMNPKLPFGIAQIGKAFRNEIAPRDFVFRAREFEQMEVEYFVRSEVWESSFEEWHGIMHAFAHAVGIPKEHIFDVEVDGEDRAHYSKRTIDFEFEYPFGRSELWGLAYRTDFDLKNHTKHSGNELSYYDEETKSRITPHVIEPSLGVDRTVLAALLSAYREDELGGEKRVYLAFKPSIAPIKAAVFPLLKNKPALVEKAREIYGALKAAVPEILFDDNGNIGKRYRRQDEIGTPFCVTVDFDTIEKDGTVTLRDRDTGGQERLSVPDAIERIRRAAFTV